MKRGCDGGLWGAASGEDGVEVDSTCSESALIVLPTLVDDDVAVHIIGLLASLFYASVSTKMAVTGVQHSLPHTLIHP